MDRMDYEVRREFVEGEEVLNSLSEEDRGNVEFAISSLTKDPWAKRYGPKQIDDKTVKIIIPVNDDDITVIFEVDIFESTVDLIEIKRRGRFKAAVDWIAGLGRFEPRRRQ
jgi:hypothetical protein